MAVDLETLVAQVWSPDVRPLAEEAWRCYNAGAMIINGSAGDGDLGAASTFMTRACELGDPDACGVVEQIAAKREAESSKVPGANLRIGECRLSRAQE